MDKKELKEYLKKRWINVRHEMILKAGKSTEQLCFLDGADYIIKELDKKFKLGIFDD